MCVICPGVCAGVALMASITNRKQHQMFLPGRVNSGHGKRPSVSLVRTAPRIGHINNLRRHVLVFARLPRCSPGVMVILSSTVRWSSKRVGQDPISLKHHALRLIEQVLKRISLPLLLSRGSGRVLIIVPRVTPGAHTTCSSGCMMP